MEKQFCGIWPWGTLTKIAASFYILDSVWCMRVVKISKNALPSSPHSVFHLIVSVVCRSYCGMPARQTLSLRLFPGYFLFITNIMLFISMFPTSYQLSTSEWAAKCETRTLVLFEEDIRSTTHTQRINTLTMVSMETEVSSRDSFLDKLSEKRYLNGF